MRKLTLALTLVAAAATAACEKTGNGEYQVKTPDVDVNVSTDTHTVRTPTIETGTQKVEVERPTVGTTKDTITVPTGCSIFPKEVPRPSRRWAQRRFANIVYWNEPSRGGHFAAMEQPQLFVDDVRAWAKQAG